MNGFVDQAIRFNDQQDKYPFIGISGARNIRFTNSQYRLIPSLLRDEAGCVVDIHPTDAVNLQIEDDDWVKVVPQRAKLE